MSIMVSISAKKLLIVDEDHGGYKAGHCIFCERRGWMDSIIHKENCKVAEVLKLKRDTESKT